MEWSKGVFAITLGISLISIILFFMTGFPFLFILLAFPPFILQRKKDLNGQGQYQKSISCPRCNTTIYNQQSNFCPNCGDPLKTP